jgi:hypothetical protein
MTTYLEGECSYRARRRRRRCRTFSDLKVEEDIP